eukprot:13787027-Heterocapsa_arctica.AAC.1
MGAGAFKWESPCTRKPFRTPTEGEHSSVRKQGAVALVEEPPGCRAVAAPHKHGRALGQKHAHVELE